jgi:glycosyltransferase involved in cell wall biosynthesis
MNVAFAVMEMWCSGGGYDVVNLCAGLRKAGHQPLVITSGGKLLEDLRSEGIPVVICPLNARTPWMLWANSRRLAKILQDHDVELFNAQGVFPAISGYWAIRQLLRKGKAIPNLATIAMFNIVTSWYYRLGSFMLNRVADHVVVESEFEKRQLLGTGMTRPVTVIHNCALADRITNVAKSREEIRAALGWPSDRVVFVMPARMSEEKGHDILLRALADPAVKNLPILCYLAGEGPRLDAMKILAKRLGVEDRVVFGGLRRDMPELYKAADVFLLCSRRESLPLSIREAMIASLPVVATDVGGIAEAVDDGITGWLVPPCNPSALAAAIARLATNAELRATMGRQGRELCSRRFDGSQWVEKTVQLMTAMKDELVERRRSRASAAPRR